MAEIMVQGARVAFEERGKGKPLILLHGWNGSRKEWLLNMKALARVFRVIAPDFPGYGDSEDLDDFSYSFDGAADFVDAFRRRLRLSSFDLAGHSMGGCIAIRYAARFPANVARLVLVATPTRASSLSNRVRMPGSSLFISVSYPFRSEAVLKWMFYHGLHKPEYQDLDFVRSNIRAMTRTSKKALVESSRMFRKMDLSEDLSRISSPVLIVFGDRDRTVDTREVSLQREQLPHPYVAIISGSGHSPNFERPEIFNELIMDFLLDESLG